MLLERTAAGIRWGTDAAVRALAVFALANVGLGLFSPRYDANAIWIQAAVTPGWLVQVPVVGFALGVLLLRRAHPAAMFFLRGLALLLALGCLADAFRYYRLLAGGRITSSFPVPLSLVIALLLLVWAVSQRKRHFTSASRTRRALWIRVLDHGTPLALLALGALAHILTFGATDYARPADAAVVFGAAVRPNGAPSQALRDRTVSACELYHRGLVKTLVLSGGRDPRAPLSEPACMARIARGRGVPDEVLVLDETGVDTAASIRAVRHLVRRRGWQRVLMVSHDYHLARIKLAAERAGVHAVTVPARESRPLLAKPWFVAREILAWGWYLLRPAASSTP